MSKIFVASILSLAVLLSTVGCSKNQEVSHTNTAPQANASNSANTAQAPARNTSTAKLNINTASESELLAAVPGLGNRMVHEFMEYRPYTSIQQFRREIGKYVDKAKVTEYEQYIFVPIKPNEADAETLQQIPGLDATEAQAIISGRPYPSPQAFLDKVAEKVSPSELNVAKTYVGS